MKILIVKGEHFAVPGVPTHAFVTPVAADVAALDLVNVIRADVGLPAATGDWKPALREAQLKRLRDNEHEDVDALEAAGDLGELAEEAECDVWIEEHDVEDLPPLPTAFEALLEAGEGVTELLEGALETHIYEPGRVPDDAPEPAAIESYRNLAQTIRLAAVMSVVMAPLTQAELEHLQGIANKPGSIVLMKPGDTPGTYDPPTSGCDDPALLVAPVRVAVGVSGGTVQWTLADRPGAVVTIVDFDVETDSSCELKLVTDADGDIDAANVYEDATKIDPAYFDRLDVAPDGDALGQAAPHYLEPADDKWLVTGTAMIPGPEGPFERFSLFVHAESAAEAGAKANAVIAAEYQAGTKTDGVRILPPSREKGGVA